MSKITAKEIKSDPQFDMMFFFGVSGQARVEQETLEEMKKRWEDWAGHLKTYVLLPQGAKEGNLLVFLDEHVENDIELAWQKSPKEGMIFHNLAITMVMCAAQSVVPEMGDGACAPVARPDKDTQRAMKRIGVVWSEEGALNRTYAVFTPAPYKGGCEICHLSERCPNSHTSPTP